MKDFKVTIIEPSRAAEWKKVLGSATVCVKSPIPTLAVLPGHPQAEIYEMDLDLLTGEQKECLIVHLAEKFDIPVDEVRADIGKMGVPILAEHCIVSVEHPQRWLS